MTQPQHIFLQIPSQLGILKCDTLKLFPFTRSAEVPCAATKLVATDSDQEIGG